MNKQLQNLSLKCAKSEGIRDYFYVSAIGYGEKVGSAFSGSLSGKEQVSVSEIANNPVRIEERTRKIHDGTGGLVDETVRFPVWFEAIAKGGTPMCEAMRLVKEILLSWLQLHPDGFPPIVINITDGESTDGDPTGVANEIKELKSSDGNALLFNVHISSQRARPIEFPDNESELPDQYASSMFQISSLLPDFMKSIAQNEYGISVSDKTRGFALNADVVSLIKFLDIGTRVNLR